MKKCLLVFLILYSSCFIIQAQHYYLYGEATTGGTHDVGVLFRFDPFTGRDTILVNFNGADGSDPGCYLLLTQTDTIYGVSCHGGSQNEGVLFSYNLSSHSENIAINFKGPNGAYPAGWGGTVVLSNGFIYGTTAIGGKDNEGVIYRYNPILNKDSTVFSFNDTDGGFTDGGLFRYNDTSFYGMASEGGLYNDGVIYRFNPLTNTENVLFSFDGGTDGGIPQGTFIKNSNGLLYGVTGQLGIYGDGTLISFNPHTNIETTLVNFNGINGKYPFCDLFLATDSLLYGMTILGGSQNDGVLFSYNVNTNTCNVVFSFDSINGANPDDGGMIEDTVNKILYGMTTKGGKYDDGVIFSYNLITGRDSVLLSFDAASNGAIPSGALLMVYDTPTGINSVKNEGEVVTVYPNPASNYLNIKISNFGNSYFYLYDALGKMVQSSELKNDLITIPLTQLADGIYYYRIVDDEQNEIKTDKLLIIR